MKYLICLMIMLFLTGCKTLENNIVVISKENFKEEKKEESSVKKVHVRTEGNITYITK